MAEVKAGEEGERGVLKSTPQPTHLSGGCPPMKPNAEISHFQQPLNRR
jgi:hypothetical protein